MRGATNQLHTCRPGTARAMPVPWVMSKAAFWSLWCFVFVLPWDKLIVIPVLGSIPRLVGLVASAVGVVHVLAQRRVRPLSWYLVLVWLIWEIAWSPERQRALLQAYVLGVSVSAGVTIHTYLLGVPAIEGTRFTAFSFNVNELGMTLALGLPMAWYL